MLYHYTSLSSLAMILKTKKIAFTSLDKVDDLEEGQCSDPVFQDQKIFAKNIFVSCWTDDPKESIPLWNMYSNQMNGVRIGLPVNPFKNYQYKEDGFEDIQQCLKCFNLGENEEGLCQLMNPQFLKLSSNPDNTEKDYEPDRHLFLRKVEYVENDEDLFPNIRKEYSIPSTDGMINHELIRPEFLGLKKRDRWQFQKEYRYVINLNRVVGGVPFDGSLDETALMIYNLMPMVEHNYEIQNHRIYLDLDEQKLNQIEILTGPTMTEGDKVLLEVLISRYAPNATVEPSSLKIV